MSQAHTDFPRNEQHASREEKKEDKSLSHHTPHILAEIYGKFSKSAAGHLVHDMVSNFNKFERVKEFKAAKQESLETNHSPSVANIVAGGQVLTATVTELIGITEIGSAAYILLNARRKVLTGAFSFVAGTYTMAASGEAGVAANKALTGSADMLKNLYHSAKDIAFKVSQYINDHSKLAALQIKHADLDSAFNFLPIAKHIDSVLPSLDDAQKNLYKYISFEVLKEYFELDNGRLKLVKKIDGIKPLDKVAIKNQLTQLQEQLSPEMKKYHLDGETKVAQEIPIEEIQNIFISYGVKPAQLEDLLKTTQGRAHANAAAIHFKEQFVQLAEHQDCIRTFNEMQQLGGVIHSAGVVFNSPALMTLGVGAVSTFQVLSAVETMTGCFSASSIAATGLALGPMTLLAAGCLGIISLFMGKDSEPDQSHMLALVQMSRQIQEVYQQLSAHLDYIDGMLRQIAGMTRQVLVNQQYLANQNRNLFRLVQSGFSMMHNQMQNLRAENRFLHKQIYDEVQYLVKMEEKSKLTSFDFKVGNCVRQIKRLSEAPLTDRTKIEIIKSMSKLDGYLDRVCSGFMNGQDEFADLEHNSHQLREFILRHQKNKKPEDLLGLLAEEWELITGKSLKTAGVDKDRLFSTSRWPLLVAQYVELSLIPALKDYDFARAFNEIEKRTENVEKLFTVIAKSNAIELLLERHKRYVTEFQLAVMNLFLIRHKAVEDKESKGDKANLTRSITIEKYFAGDAGAGEQLEPILSKIDYNWLLLAKLSELAKINVDQRRLLASLSRSSTLMQQPFNADALASKTSAIVFCDSLWEVRSYGDRGIDRGWNRLYAQRKNEHLDIIGGNTIRIAGSNKIILMSYDYRPPNPSYHPGGIRKSYISQYDIATAKEDVTTIDLDTVGFATVPPNYYTKDLANHAWSSTHTVTTPDGTPYLVWFTGGSGHVTMFNLKDNKYVYCDNSGTKAEFSVPLPVNSARNSTLSTLNTSCYTTIINNILIVHLLDWKEQGSVQVNTRAFDLVQRKWLPFDNLLFLELAYYNVFFDSLIKSPNQFFATTIANSALAYGFVKSGKEIDIAIQNRQIEKEFKHSSMRQDKKPIVTENISYPYEAKEILQTKANSLLVNGKHELFIIVTFKSPDDRPKLAVLSWNPSDKKKRHTIFNDLPPLHDVADWQNLHIVQAAISGKEYLIITLQNPQHCDLVFFYNPDTNKISSLPDGPQHQFHRSAGLINARKKYPGFYPIQLPAPCFVTQHDMAVLYFPTIRDSGFGKPLKIELVCYPLTPLLHNHLIMTPLIENKESSNTALVTKNNIEVDIEAVKVLIQASQIVTLENKQEVKREEKLPQNNTFSRVYEKAKNNFKKIIIFTEKLKDEYPIKKEKIQEVDNLFLQLDNIVTTQSDEQLSKALPMLIALSDALDDIDGTLKVNVSGYFPGLGENVGRLLQDLNKEIDAIKLKLKRPVPSASAVGGLWKAKPVLSSASLSSSARPN